MAFIGGEDRTWRVRLNVEVPGVVGRTAAVGRAARMLEAFRGKVAGDGAQLTIVLTVTADDGLTAVARAAHETLTTLARCGAPDATVRDYGVEEYVELVGLDALIAQL